jgi:cytochrome c oxidase cbb3-type subunit IV
MKFIHYLKNIDDVTWYPIITFILFGLFFMLILLWVFGARKNYIDQAKQIPLKD